MTVGFNIVYISEYRICFVRNIAGMRFQTIIFLRPQRQKRL